MNLEKAIEIKTDYVEHLPPGVNEDWIKADKLSIEALKREKANRDNPDFVMVGELPGETKD